MRLIRKGNVPIELERKKTCWNCNSIIAYTDKDTHFDMNLDRYIECPLCKQYLYTSIFDRKIKPKKIRGYFLGKK